MTMTVFVLLCLTVRRIQYLRLKSLEPLKVRWLLKSYLERIWKEAAVADACRDLSQSSQHPGRDLNQSLSGASQKSYCYTKALGWIMHNTLWVAHYSRKPSSSVEPEDSFSCSQKPVTCTDPPINPIHNLVPSFFKIHFNIILLSTTIPPK